MSDAPERIRQPDEPPNSSPLEGSVLAFRSAERVSTKHRRSGSSRRLSVPITDYGTRVDGSPAIDGAPNSEPAGKPGRRTSRPHQPANRSLHRSLIAGRALVDLLALTAALVLATAVRFGWEGFGTPTPYRRWYGPWLPIWIPLWWGGLVAAGLYDRLRTENPAEELRRIIHGVSLGALAALVSSFSAGFPLSRSWLLLAVGSAFVTVTFGRLGMRKLLHALRRRGWFRRRALIIGADASGRALSRSVAQAPWEGIDVIGYVAVDGDAPGHCPGDMILGTVDRLRYLVGSLQVAEVFVTPTVAGNGHLSDVVAALDGVPVDLRVAPGLEGFLTSRLTVHPLGDRTLVSVERVELQRTQRLLKRALDLVLASVLLVLVAPVIAFSALIVWLDSPGPVFFRQRRVGAGGKEFMLWKIRSMVANAEQIQMSADLNEADGLLFKMRRDPRITRVGRLLRRTCLDELPQLFNVIAGDMSLVGPRPPLPDEVAQYDKRIGRRLLVRPGITGLWQINGRHELDFDEYIRLDLLYVQNWSIALDLYILAKTLPAVLAGRGAS